MPSAWTGRRRCHHRLPGGSGGSPPATLKPPAIVSLYLGDADTLFTSIATKPHHAWFPAVRLKPPVVRFKNDPRSGPLWERLKLPPPAF
jgi:hypothetical protein